MARRPARAGQGLGRRRDNLALCPRAGQRLHRRVVAASGRRKRAERRRTRRLRHLVAALTALVLAVGRAGRVRVPAAARGRRARDDANSRERRHRGQQVARPGPAARRAARVAAYGIARTPQAAASLLESSGARPRPRLYDSAGGPVGRPQPGPPAARGGRARTARCGCGTWPAPATRSGRRTARRRRATARCTRPRSARTARSWPRPGAAARYSCGTSADPGIRCALRHADRPDEHGLLGRVQPGRPDLAAGSADDTVRLWNLSDPAHPARRRPLTGAPGTSTRSRSARTATCWPRAARTTRSGCGTSPTRRAEAARPPAGRARRLSGGGVQPATANLLAAASQDHKVWLWRLSDGRAGPDGTLAGAADWMNAVAFSPDGRQLAAGTADASVLVWNVHPRAGRDAAAPAAGHLAGLGRDRPACRGRRRRHRVAWTLPDPGPGRRQRGRPASRTARMARRSRSAAQNVQLWNRRRTPSEPRVPARHRSPTRSRSPRTGTHRGRPRRRHGRVLDAGTLAPAGARSGVTAAAATPSRSRSARTARSWPPARDDGTLRLWSLADPARPPLLASAHDSGTYVYTVVFAPDGSRSPRPAPTTSPGCGTWPTRPRRPARPAADRPASYAIGLAFSPDGTLLAVGSADKTCGCGTSPIRPARH